VDTRYNKVQSPNRMSMDIQYSSSPELDSSYQDLKALMIFLNQNIDDNKYNSKQIKVIKGCLKDAFIYQKSIEDYNQSQSLPRTWSDLNKYTWFV